MNYLPIIGIAKDLTEFVNVADAIICTRLPNSVHVLAILASCWLYFWCNVIFDCLFPSALLWS